jgi:hypothetical protein
MAAVKLADRRELPRTRTAARLGWSLFALSVLLFVPALILNLRLPQYADLAFTTGELLLRLAFLLFGWFGALIVSRRPGHPIGWVLCALGLMSGFGAFAVEYAVYGLITRPGAVPAAATVAWCDTWEFAVDFGLVAALLLLFPSGRPPSPRWRWVLWLAATGVVLATVGALGLWPLRGRALLQLYTPDPVGVLGVLYRLGSWATEVAILAAVASLVVRFRRARGAERQQLKWLFYWVAVLVVGFPITGVVLDRVSSELAADLIFALLIVPIPLAVGVAIVRHRLYDVDRLINRTLVYGLLTALLGGVYAGAVLVLGALFGGITQRPPSWAVAGATLAVAALFQPARRRIQAVVDRRFNRRKYNAAKTVEAFSLRLRDEVDLDALSAELLAVVDKTMEPTQASLWLRPPPPGSPGTAPRAPRPTPWAY